MMGVALVITSLVASGMLLMRAGHVNAHNNGPRPGWGHGDEHHEHTGPPDHSTLPGNGHGDDDDHTGPPGKSTFPGEEHEHGSDHSHAGEHGGHNGHNGHGDD